MTLVTTTKRKPGRKSELERIQTKHEAEQHAIRLERAAAIEAKRAPRLQPDTKGSLIAILVIAATVLLPAFAISYDTTVAVAEWIKLPWAFLDYVVPGILELLIIFSSYDYLISESRSRGSGRMPFWVMIGFSAVAVVANASHTISAWGSQFGTSHWQSLVGVTLAAAAPFVCVYLAKRLSKLVFAESE